MNKDKPFNLALMISFAWHLFLMFGVTIVVLPTSLPMARVSNIAFLGPLLEKTAFEMMMDTTDRKDETTYTQSAGPGTMVMGPADGLMDIDFKDIISLEQDKSEATKETAYNSMFENSKVAPPAGNIETDLKSEEEQKDNFSIEGPLAGRDIMSRPGDPVIEARIGEREDSFSVKLKINVMPEGSVNDVTLLASSGYPDIDISAINYVKAFKFSALGADVVNAQNEWGDITVNFKTR